MGRWCKHVASSVSVAKAGTDRQRGEWDGSRLSSASLRPQSMLEGSDDQPLLMSVRDTQSFFDQLKPDHDLC